MIALIVFRAKEISSSSTTVYTYDNVGRIKLVLAGSGSSLTKANATQYVEYEYSDAGRKVKVIYGGLYETDYTLNAWGEVVAASDGAAIAWIPATAVGKQNLVNIGIC